MTFAVPSLGIKVDAVPGRLNQGGFMPKREGVYYGQSYAPKTQYSFANNIVVVN